MGVLFVRLLNMKDVLSKDAQSNLSLTKLNKFVTSAGFTGVISDLGGPTANMYKLRCKSKKAESTCRRLSVFTLIFVNIWTPTTRRRLSYIKKHVM